jgi:hypothetical protein
MMWEVKSILQQSNEQQKAKVEIEALFDHCNALKYKLKLAAFDYNSDYNRIMMTTLIMTTLMIIIIIMIIMFSGTLIQHHETCYVFYDYW